MLAAVVSHQNVKLPSLLFVVIKNLHDLASLKNSVWKRWQNTMVQIISHLSQ